MDIMSLTNSELDKIINTTLLEGKTGYKINVPRKTAEGIVIDNYEYTLSDLFKEKLRRVKHRIYIQVANSSYDDLMYQVARSAYHMGRWGHPVTDLDELLKSESLAKDENKKENVG